MNTFRAPSLVLPLLLIVSSCTKDDPVQLQDQVASDRLSGESVLSSETTLNVRNGIGPVVIEWGGLEDRIRWFVNRQVTGYDIRESRAQLQAIQLREQRGADTAYVATSYPVQMNQFRYEALLSVGIPYRMRCLVDSVDGSITIAHLGADVRIRNTHGVSIDALNASCDIMALDGPNTLNIILPDGGHCIVTAAEGDISLTVPASVSATVSARSRNGSVTHAGLSFGSLVQVVDSLSGMLGAGSGEIRLYTSRGNILIRGM
jgi:hypothetical protein